MNIGFIGLGIMGRPMAKNLLKAGWKLTVFDLNEEAMRDVALCGARQGESICETAAGADVLMTMLPNSPQVRAVLLGEGGALEGLRAGSTVIDMSSINPVDSREFAGILAERGVDMLDAPVSGGEPKAIDGTLAFMVGGKEETFARFEPLLRCMGSTVTRVGGAGAGNVAKLCNQVIVAVNIAAVSEALMLGQRCGVNPAEVFEAIRGGLAGSTVMDAKAPMMLAGNFKPGFKLDLHIKDLNNVLDAARSVDAPTPLTSQVMEMMKMLHRMGEGASDHSALVKYYEHMAGTEVCG